MDNKIFAAYAMQVPASSLLLYLPLMLCVQYSHHAVGCVKQTAVPCTQLVSDTLLITHRWSSMVSSQVDWWW